MKADLRRILIKKCGSDGFFESVLSDSAVSTAVSCLALEISNSEKYAEQIYSAKNWLLNHQNSDGLYGDSPESPANLTATFMSYVVLSRDENNHAKLERAKDYLLQHFGDFSFASIRKGFLNKYGSDLTFSVPILAMATIAGFFQDARQAWSAMPQFPFEMVVFPEKIFHCLNLPVVSYAIPALISVGMAQNAHAGNGLMKRIRSGVSKRALRILTEKQPASGGFLEAAPLTAFCALCLCAAGLSEHVVLENALRFLLETQRSNGAWPIDHSLRQWVTSLTLTILSDSFSESEKAFYRDLLKSHQTSTVHPFTKSAPGGWGWTTRSGSVPDADDTSAALVALHALGEGPGENVLNGINWLLNLQNRDGGIPTFCRGWGHLPFDRSCPDISAHAYKALSLYENKLPRVMQRKVISAKKRILRYLEKSQRADGSFVPLWFGDQLAPDKSAPVYGSAVVLEHLSGEGTARIMERTKNFLLSCQHQSGGWGSCDSEHDYVIFTARCVRALKPFEDTKPAVQRALEFLRPYFENPASVPREPIGLYFAHLWYDEELYAPIFLAGCQGGS
jgi:squalene-hopene/tetraprenyl-beta-curcumene cyclase